MAFSSRPKSTKASRNLHPMDCQREEDRSWVQRDWNSGTLNHDDYKILRVVIEISSYQRSGAETGGRRRRGKPLSMPPTRSLSLLACREEITVSALRSVMTMAALHLMIFFFFIIKRRWGIPCSYPTGFQSYLAIFISDHNFIG